MRHKLLSIALLSAVLITSACDKFLDITPKGATLLNNIDDLELLATGQYSQSCWSYTNYQEVLVNDVYGNSTSFMTSTTNTNTLSAAYLTYNETIDRAALTESDVAYSRNYSSICALNHVIISIPTVAGDEARKAKIMAQAKVKRAYFHYVMAITFCKQYDAATAEQEGGIPYVEDMNMGEENVKLSLKETFEKMLADCTDEIIAALPDEADNVEMPGKAFGYAIRSKIYLQMKQYDKSLADALQSIRYNSNIEDRRGVVSAPTSFKRAVNHPGNLFYTEPVSSGAVMMLLSLETAQLFEDGDIVKDYAIASQTATKTTYVWNPVTISGLSETVLQWGLTSKYRLNTGVTCEQMYYIAAEGYIRTGNITEGMNLINTVREYRIAPEKYTRLSASTEAEAMRILMRCKRIECLFTYNTYADCKRWNTETAYKQTITRTLEGVTYTLSPDSPLWVAPFPQVATQYNSTLTQNY